MIEMRLRVHSTCRAEAGAWRLAMNSVALRWRVAPELVAAAVVRLLGPSSELLAPAEWPALSAAACVADRLAIYILSQDWMCPVTMQDWTWCYRDGAYTQWCIHAAEACSRACATANPAAALTWAEPLSPPRAAAVARLGPASGAEWAELSLRGCRFFLLRRSPTRRQGLLGLSSSEHARH
jgi:hypothetical protein